VQRPIRIHATEMKPEEWRPIEAEADQVVLAALTLVDKSSWYLLFHYRKNLWHRSYAASLRKPQTLAWYQVQRPPKPPSFRTPVFPEPMGRFWLYSQPASRRYYGFLGYQWLHHGFIVGRFWLYSLPARLRYYGFLGYQWLHHGFIVGRFWLYSLPARLRYYGFFGYQWLHHGFVVSRFLAVTLPFRLSIVISRVLLMSDRVLGWLFGVPPQVCPWHWWWPYQREIVRPFLAAVDAFEGRILLLYNDEYTLAPNIRKASCTVQSLVSFCSTSRTLDDMRNVTEGFDIVFCLSPLTTVASGAAFAVVDQVLRPGGRLVISVACYGKLSTKREIDAVPSNFKLIEQRHVGSIGTALIMHSFAWLRDHLSGFSSIRRPPCLRWRIARLAVAPLILIIYPVMSIAASVLNVFGRSDRLYVENSIVLEKTGVPARISVCPSDFAGSQICAASEASDGSAVRPIVG
jgi:hypothetical protein